MNVDAIRKEIAPYVVNGELTYNDFDKIFSFLPRKEQYPIVYTIQDDLKIELVDEITSAPVEEKVPDETLPLIFRTAKEIKASNKILIALIQKGDEQARQDICIKNQGLVAKFANYYFEKFPCSLELDDLIQEGNIGMLRAAELFDFARETEFSTYATWWIKQKILRALVSTGLTVRLPVHVVEKILKASRLEKDFLIQGHGLKRRIELIAKEMATTPEDISYLFSLRAVYLNIVSLDKPVDEESDSLLIDFIEDTSMPDPAETASFVLLKEQLEDVLNTLTPREKDVLRLRYGLEDGRERTLEEIGKSFGVTRERIRQIEAEALRKLRHPACSKKLKDFLD